MDELHLLTDFHKGAARQGPGGEAETLRALELAGLDRSRRLAVADIGCGTGASTLLLARELDAQVTAVDFLPPFLDVLETRAREAGVAGRIEPLPCAMDELPFQEAAFDVVWSEGAVYNMGFEAGVAYWRRFLKPGGVLAVSELTWFTAERPPELDAYWQAEYPEVDTAPAKLAVLERQGYALLGYFPLPAHCWLDNYYRPMQARFEAFLDRHGHSQQAQAIVEAEKKEIALYEAYSEYYGYGFYVARRGKG
jgi:ubiquinone/menaquinone biosynthesis C-methylase UbiE